MKEKYISRVDSSKSKMYGYLLRLYKNKGVLFQQWFPDKKYGGKEASFEAAKEVRDAKIIELNYNPGSGLSNLGWKPVLLDREPKSNTGYLGVYESHEFKTLRDGSKKKSSYIAASYVEEKGKSKLKKFYFGKKRTREEALREAVRFRSAKELSLRAAAVEYNRKLQQRFIEAENKLLAEQKKQRSSKKSRPLAAVSN